ncbi:cupin domain-containing protein [Oxalobacteraceae bacterium CAVE-383]|nr:cupin domain-containing protein [Oxalobacteraceae bacterium CAVE-383]
MNIVNWLANLERIDYDDVVGIKIAKLAGDANFSTYLTAIDLGKSVSPHYHKNGDEHYHIIRGRGEITLTNLDSMEITTIAIDEQSSFTVPENTLHQLKNSGDEPLILMFSCPESHLDEDRFLL